MIVPLAKLKWLKKLHKNALSALIASATLLFWAAPIYAQKDAINILIIHSYNEHIPWNKSFTSGLESFESKSDVRFNIFREYLDVYRLPLASHERELVDAMRAKYSRLGIDVVVGESDEAASFLLEHKDHFAPDAAEVIFSSFSLDSEAKRVVFDQDIATVAIKGVQLALEQNPDAQDVLIIHGNHSEASVRVSSIQSVLEDSPEIRVEVVSDFSLEGLSSKLESFPSDGIIFYSLVFQDNTGRSYTPRGFLDVVADVSPAPVYVGYSTLIGGGAVGGYVIDGEALAENMLLAAIDYQQDGAFSNKYEATTELFDGTALQRHDIKLGLLSPNTVVVNKPKIFEEVVSFFLGAFVISVFAIAGISFLARRNARLKGLNQKLEKTRVELDQDNKHLNHLAMYDPLTEVYNRRATLPLIIEAMKQVPRGEQGAAIILLDIDHFKVVNDTYGHAVGDEILKELVHVIRKPLRADDVLARWGGEEFLVLLRVTDYDDAGIVAEKIRIAVEEAAFTMAGIRITLSAGVAPLSMTLGFDEAFKLADKALYHSKNNGRNLVTVT